MNAKRLAELRKGKIIRESDWHDLLDALEEAVASMRRIAERAGPFSQDQLQHAENVIDAMGAEADAFLAAWDGE